MKTEEEIRKALKRATKLADHFNKMGKYSAARHYEGKEEAFMWILGEGEK